MFYLVRGLLRLFPGGGGHVCCGVTAGGLEARQTKVEGGRGLDQEQDRLLYGVQDRPAGGLHGTSAIVTRIKIV